MAENPVTVFYDNLSSDDEIFEGSINNQPETDLKNDDVTKPNVDNNSSGELSES